MGKYFARYFIESPNAIGIRNDIENGKVLGWKFNFGSNEIGLYDHKQGLWADCYIEADSQLSAEEKSKIFIENILNLIDFSTSSASNSPFFISIYEATDGLSSRAFKQIFYTSIPDRNIVAINKEIFEEIFYTFNKNQDARITRAISWLRKGYLEQKFIDKFVAFWTGLESINELLCDLLNIANKDRKTRCNRCGNLISSVSSVGIKRLFVDIIDIKTELFEKIRKARGKLLHGGGPLDNNFIEEIKRYIPLVKKALIMGIGRLLSIKSETIEKILQKNNRLYNERLRIILKANLMNFIPPSLDEFGKQPRFDLIEQNLLERLVDKKGKLNLKVKSNFIAQNAIFNNISFELWGDDNSALEKLNLLISNNYATKNLSTKSKG
jgi:hypothetical protein